MPTLPLVIQQFKEQRDDFQGGGMENRSATVRRQGKQQRWAIENYRNEGGPRVSARLQNGLLALESKKPVREAWPFSDQIIPP